MCGNTVDVDSAFKPIVTGASNKYADIVRNDEIVSDDWSDASAGRWLPRRTIATERVRLVKLLRVVAIGEEEILVELSSC